MKLERSNKYNKKLTNGIATVLLSSLILTGCSNAKAISNDSTDVELETVAPIEAVVEITPVPATPEPTATIEPTPTPFVTPNEAYIKSELRDLLLVDGSEENVAAAYGCLLFEKDGQEKVMNIYMPEISNDKEFVIRDVFTNEDLFILHRNDPGFVGFTQNSTYFAKELSEIDVINPYFEDVKITGIDFLFFRYYFLYGKEYADKSMLETDLKKDMTAEYYNTADYSYTIEEVARLYIKYLPGEYRVSSQEIVNSLEDEHVKKLS